ncbi:hypothetical protein DL546_002475 [Coniochaeta pulveracea]|uniref:Uncharacterized protein n=1 Tax=Coniochaeta pulveracea TaxID=177199 RepID=A0A420XY41_9PEZI|nr:hypothetical protein DL546_002475 [Coniochaeta pulveracea]
MSTTHFPGAVRSIDARLSRVSSPKPAPLASVWDTSLTARYADVETRRMDGDASVPPILVTKTDVSTLQSKTIVAECIFDAACHGVHSSGGSTCGSVRPIPVPSRAAKTQRNQIVVVGRISLAQRRVVTGSSHRERHSAKGIAVRYKAVPTLRSKAVVASSTCPVSETAAIACESQVARTVMNTSLARKTDVTAMRMEPVRSADATNAITMDAPKNPGPVLTSAASIPANPLNVGCHYPISRTPAPSTAAATSAERPTAPKEHEAPQATAVLTPAPSRIAPKPDRSSLRTVTTTGVE